MKTYMNETEVIEYVRSAAQNHGGQTALAAACGVGKQHITDIMMGRRPPGRKVCRYLGLTRQTVFSRSKTRISKAS